MKLSYRLTLMLISLLIVLAVGRLSMGNFGFATNQFWFIAGALLLVMLSLVDQPHFSKDANVFVNGVTALISLFVITESQRPGIWWIFFLWAIYLIISSFFLMAIRSRNLFIETKTVLFFSRLNRIIGRPEAIFSAFFLWGIFLQFSYPKDGITINALFLFWAVFMILNVPSVAQVVADLFSRVEKIIPQAGVVTGIQSPRLASLKLNSDIEGSLVGRKVNLVLTNEVQVAEGVLFEDRIIKGARYGRLAITSFGESWNKVGSEDRINIDLPDVPHYSQKIVGVVSAGSSIGKLVFEIDPQIVLNAGAIVKVNTSFGDTYYQIISAAVFDESSSEKDNVLQNVRVVAGQLGQWQAERAAFSIIDWVAPAGEIVAVNEGEEFAGVVPEERCFIGNVPKSSFPVHVHVSDSITHNTALIGVTGSGKSYLAFHLIKTYIDAGIKVLILDLTRQHWQHLEHLNPTPIAQVGALDEWLAGPSNLAIYQFANATDGLPKATAIFVEQCFEWLKNNTQLQAGVDVSAKLCIVLEEAHSLIPEWNQVAQTTDVQFVNRTARVVLQGRKFGLGSLLITQRTANVTKTILNQCNTIFALRSFDQTGLDFLRNYMGEEYSQTISTLPDRTAILVGKASSSDRPIILKIADFTIHEIQN